MVKAAVKKSPAKTERYFEQTFLKPGRYHIGGGRFANVTAADIAKHVTSTKKLIKAGYAPPVLLAHAKPGSKAGAPVLESDAAADRVKNGVGWLDGVRVNEAGEAVHTLRITNPKAAEAINEGSIKFASPELRQSWQDGSGRKWENIISHMALTHKPRNTDQSAFAEVAPTGVAEVAVAQYSLDDFVALGDDDDESDEDDDNDGVPDALDKDADGDGEADADEADGPDMPEGEGNADTLKMKERLQAAIAHLKEMGIVLPEDTIDADPMVFLDRLLTGLMTAGASKKAAETDNADDDGDDDIDDGSGGQKPEVVEQRGIGQYSCDELGGCPPIVAKLIKHQRKDLLGECDKLIGTSQMTPAFRDKLMGLKAAKQFSADGDFRPMLTVRQLVRLIGEMVPPGATLSADGLDTQFGLEDHFDGDKHRRKDGSGQMSAAEAKRLVDEQANTTLTGVLRK